MNTYNQTAVNWDPEIEEPGILKDILFTKGYPVTFIDEDENIINELNQTDNTVFFLDVSPDELRLYKFSPHNNKLNPQIKIIINAGRLSLGKNLKRKGEMVFYCMKPYTLDEISNVFDRAILN